MLVTLTALSPSSPAQCGWSNRFDAPGTGDGTNARVYDMTVFDQGIGIPTQLIAGGDFTAAGSATVPTHVASFSGSAWTPLGSGSTDGSVFGVTTYIGAPFGLASFGPEIYAGGAFTTMDGVAASHVSFYDGVNWYPCPDTGTGVDGTDGNVYALLTHDFGFPLPPMLFVGGQFSNAGGFPANNVACWTGTGWFQLGLPSTCVGGGTAGGTIPGRVDALCVFDDGSGPALYVGGFFTSVECGTPANLVAKFDPFTWTWSAVGTLAGTNVYDLVVFDDGTGPALYAGGDLSSMGNVVKWDGSTWSTVGLGLNDAVRDLLVYQCGGAPQLVAGGHFSASNSGSPCPRVSHFVDGDWQRIDGPAIGLVGGSPSIALCMADFEDNVHQEDLHVGGVFTTAEGLNSTFFAASCACRMAPFPMINGEVAVTTMGAIGEDFALSLVDVRPPFPAANTNWDAPMFHNDFQPSAATETWNLDNLGQVFGVCLDGENPPNIYVSATSVYPIDVFTTEGPGAVFKIDGVTGDISTFMTTGTGFMGTNTLPNLGPALGDICYDRYHDQFFVSNFEDGQIYRVSAAGLVLQTLDPFLLDASAGSIAPLGERVWAVQVFSSRELYFSRCSEDGTTNGAGTPNNSIWVAGLAPTGAFIGGTVLAKTLPVVGSQTYPAQCSDIAFSPDHKRMLIAQRTMDDGTGSGAHSSAVLEFIGGTVGNPTAWTTTGANSYWIGAYPGNLNAAGGADYDCDLNVFATGDGLKYSFPDYIYGLQRIPAGGNTAGVGATSTSQIHDMNRITNQSNKLQIGDCEVRKACVKHFWTYCTSKINSLGCYPSVSAVGDPSATAPNGFVVTCSMVVGQKTGLLFYGRNGPAAAPFQGGTMCVASPIRRTPPSNSGGNPNLCDGVYAIDMNAYAASGIDPALQVPGTVVDCQFWSRDPSAPFNTSLSDGLEYFIDI